MAVDHGESQTRGTEYLRSDVVNKASKYKPVCYRYYGKDRVTYFIYYRNSSDAAIIVLKVVVVELSIITYWRI